MDKAKSPILAERVASLGPPPADARPAGGYMYDGTFFLLESKAHALDEEVVVCVHGVGSYSYYYEAMTAHLIEAGLTVLRYDLFGRGYSDYPLSSPEEAFTGQAHVAQLRGLLTFLGLQDRIHLVGHSMGGAVAALYAAQYGAGSLSLLAPAGLIDLKGLKHVRRFRCLHGLVRSSLRRGQESFFRADFHNTQSQVCITTVAAMLAMQRKRPFLFEASWHCLLHGPLSATDAQVALIDRGIPVFLAWGERDKTVPMVPNMA
eukprot:CAMPEP_0173218014 /NCGR_PEP_ID=MMETSP1142-20121109/814_1 /TAXON_ID=483371 /ORGANISM="non described non described, Strain CCMP2298" /LENGTH=260 /DNA_ID=CAMNT_0014145655 /DNA_START=265 /DNA_END=1043 /DNA_ORIENTATION=+